MGSIDLELEIEIEIEIWRPKNIFNKS
jgi:hypothetical protein